MKYLISLFVVLSALSCLADEQKEPTLAEAKAAFAKADQALNQAWAAAKKALPERVFSELTIRQREWVEFRDGRARLETHQKDEAEAKRSPSYFSATEWLTDDRVKWLRGRTKSEDDTLTGSWIDSYGGTMEIVEQEGRLLFVFNVVRGHTSDVGSSDGEIEVIGANTYLYHGLHAYFDGIYCKVAPLDDKEKAVVIKAAESGEVPEE